MAQVICKAFRPTTKSKLMIEIPEDVGVDPDDVVQWVGEEFNYMFMPLELYVKPTKED